MSISWWLHYLFAFTRRQWDVDVITRSISHNLWIDRLVFSFGNKKSAVYEVHHASYKKKKSTCKSSAARVLFVASMWLCCFIFIFFILMCSVWVQVTGITRLRGHNNPPPPTHPSLFPHSSKGSSFLRCQGPPDVRGGGGARKELSKRGTARWMESTVTLGCAGIRGRWRARRCVPSSFPLCLIMRLLMLIPSLQCLAFH